MIFNKYRLEDITDKIGDGIHGTPEYDDNGDYYFVNGNNLVDGDIVLKKDTKRINEEQYRKNKRDLNKNTLLVSINGTLGNVAKYNNEKIILGKSACYMNVKDEYNVDYVYFVFESPEFKKYLQYGANGTTIKNVPLSAIRNYEISIPSKENQDKIVRILKSIEDKIKLNNKINNNLLELSKQLYLNTFSNTSVFEDIKLGDLCNIKYGKGLPTTKILDSGYPVYGGNGIIGYYNSKLYDESQVLVSCRGAASGKVVLSKPNSFVTNNSLILEVDRLYHHYLKEYCLLNQFFAYTTGSAQPQITIDNIKDIIIKIPDAPILEDFNSKCESIEIKYFLNIEQNETLEQLRDTLLPKLMNGEIDLDNIEI